MKKPRGQSPLKFCTFGSKRPQELLYSYMASSSRRSNFDRYAIYVPRSTPRCLMVRSHKDQTEPNYLPSHPCLNRTVRIKAPRGCRICQTAHKLYLLRLQLSIRMLRGICLMPYVPMLDEVQGSLSLSPAPPVPPRPSRRHRVLANSQHLPSLQRRKPVMSPIPPQPLIQLITEPPLIPQFWSQLVNLIKFVPSTCREPSQRSHRERVDLLRTSGVIPMDEGLPRSYPNPRIFRGQIYPGQG